MITLIAFLLGVGGPTLFIIFLLELAAGGTSRTTRVEYDSPDVCTAVTPPPVPDEARLALAEMRDAVERGWVTCAAMVIASSEAMLTLAGNDTVRARHAAARINRQWQEARERGLEPHVRQALRDAKARQSG